MANTIKITPKELTAQAVKLEALDDRLGEAMAKSDQAFRLLCDALSAAFTPNMRTKATKLMRNMETLRRSIHTGADVARECAASYENADKVLRDKIGDELPASIQVLPTSEQKVEHPYDERIRDVMAQEKADMANGTAPKYWSWYYGKKSGRTDSWCAVFVSYMLEKAGIDVDAPLKESTWFQTSPDYQYRYLQNKGFIHTKSEGYQPKIGDTVYYRGSGNSIGHVAIISDIRDGKIYTLHGNVGKPTIMEIREDYYINTNGVCDIVGYGDMSAFADFQA